MSHFFTVPFLTQRVPKITTLYCTFLHFIAPRGGFITALTFSLIKLPPSLYSFNTTTVR